MPLTPEQARIRRAFLLVQTLFIASWSLWVPTFLFFLDDLFPNNPANQSAIVAIYLVFVCCLEVPTGVIADRWNGYQTFLLSSLIFLVGNALYAVAPFVDAEGTRFQFALAGEFFSALGVAFYSGSFDKWFTSTLEQARVVESSHAAFRLLRGHRNLVILLAGGVGIVLYGWLRSHGDLLGARSWDQAMLLPHLWSAVLVAAGLVVAWWTQRSLSDARTPLSGAATTDMPPERRLGPMKTFLQAWSFLFRIPSLLSLTLVQATAQIEITYAAFYVSQTVGSSVLASAAPLKFWEDDVVLAAFMAYWGLGRALRVFGNWISSRAIVGAFPAALMLGHAALLVTASAALLWAPPASREVAQGALLAIGGLSSFLVVGMVEVSADSEMADRAPRDLMASIFSARSMVASLIAAIAFPIGTLLSRSAPASVAPTILLGTLFAISSIICAIALVAPRGTEWTLGTRTGLWAVWGITLPLAFSLAMWWPSLESRLAPVQRLVAEAGGHAWLLLPGLPPARVIVATSLALGVVAVGVGVVCLVAGTTGSRAGADASKAATLVAAFKSHRMLHTEVLSPIARAIRYLREENVRDATATLVRVNHSLRARLVRPRASEARYGLVEALDRVVLERIDSSALAGESAPAPGAIQGRWRSRVPKDAWEVSVSYTSGLPLKDVVGVSQAELDATLRDAFDNALKSVSQRGETSGQPGLVEITVVETAKVFWLYFVDNGVGLGGKNHQEHEIEAIRRGSMGLMSAGLLTRAGRLAYYLDEGPQGGAIVRISIPRAEEAPAPPPVEQLPAEEEEDRRARTHR